MFLSRLFKHTRAKVMALAGLTLVFGAAAAVSTVAATQKNEIVETKAATATQEKPIVITHDQTWYMDQAAVYYWGTDITARTIAVTKVSDYCGYVVLPKNVTGFKVLRTNETLPEDAYPSTAWNATSDITYNTSYNWVSLTGDVSVTYNSSKTCIPTGTPVFFDASALTGYNWSDASAVPYMAAWLNSTWYGVSSGTAWTQMTRIGSTEYYYCVASSDMILDGLAFTRNSTSGSGWDNKWSQTTDITAGYGFNPFLVTYLKNYQTGGNEDWLVGDDEATANIYGALFLNNVTCSGSGSITSSSSAWTTVSNVYSGLSTLVQYILWEGTAASSGDYYKQALNRYDYIVFYKQYSGYTDFINRSTSSGKMSYAAVVSPLPHSSELPLTTTLWIVLGAGVFGLGVIGAAYFVSKKKRHRA